MKTVSIVASVGFYLAVLAAVGGRCRLRRCCSKGNMEPWPHWLWF